MWSHVVRLHKNEMWRGTLPQYFKAGFFGKFFILTSLNLSGSSYPGAVAHNERAQSGCESMETRGRHSLIIAHVHVLKALALVQQPPQAVNARGGETRETNIILCYPMLYF